MTGKFKYGKTAVCVIITVLIWVWADLALDERWPVSNVTISVAKSTNPALWVSFNEESSSSIDKIVLKGPASRIGEVKRKLRDGSLILKFFLDAGQEGMDNPDKYPLDVLNFLRKSDQIKQLGLTVESCQPETLFVDVVGLVKKPLKVKCEDEGRNPVTATIEPAQVDMFVPPYWEGEKLIATVLLTRREIEQARVAAIERAPYIKMPDQTTREVPTMVKITTLPEEDQLGDYLITATLSIALSPTLQGKYKVVVTNPVAVMGHIAIRATADAKRAYEMQPYPRMTLYILDDDIKKGTEEQRRKVVYNFPDEYVREREIELNQEPVEARFKLIPLASTETPSGGVE